MALPLNLPPSQMQTKWKSQIDPLLGNPILQGHQLTGIALTANKPLAVNHLLSRIPQGWFVVDQNASGSISRTQPFNSSTLTLEATADCVISLWVY